MKTMLTLCLLFATVKVFADQSYYPISTLEIFHNTNTPSDELKHAIFDLSEKIHVIHVSENDVLADVCPLSSRCYSQKINFTYEEARKIMFGELFLEKFGQEKYSITDVYCNIHVDETKGVGPGRIPNPNYLNCEHTWPQSKFSKKFPSELQKTDLHHIFPSDMRANSTRNNFPFGDVVRGQVTHSQCLDSKIGESSELGSRVFEPPHEHKGNVARAIFYFSTRYKMPIDKSEAKYLKIWNEEDPVDAAEIKRNDRIMELQGNRNPFIDYPELINRL